MKKLIFIIFILIGCVATPIKETGVTFTLKNNTSKHASYLIYWIDHPFKEQTTDPHIVAGGGVPAHQKYVWETEYKISGHYVIEWYIEQVLKKTETGFESTLEPTDIVEKADYTYQSCNDPYEMLTWIIYGEPQVAESTKYGAVVLLIVGNPGKTECEKSIAQFAIIVVDIDDKTGELPVNTFIVAYMWEGPNGYIAYKYCPETKCYKLVEQKGVSA